MVKKLIILTIILIPAALTIIFLKDVYRGEFLFLHDEFLVLNKHENFNIFFTQNPADFGIANTTILIVTFFDRLYYTFTYQLGLDIYDSQKLLYFIKILLLVLLPFIGLRKLSTLFHKNKHEDIYVFLISLWYSFNTYTLIYWHGNAFSLTLLICYSLAPLAFYYYHKSLFDRKDISDKFITILLFFLMSFALYLFAVFVFFLILYTFFYSYLSRAKLLVIFKHILTLTLIYLPFFPLIILIPYEMFINVNKTMNLVGGETYGMLQGGFLYQLLMWYSWGIYTHWELRNIYTFSDYFRFFPSIFAPFLVYGLIFYAFLKKRKNIFSLVFISIFLVFLFFIKGAQKPLGEIFVSLINYFPPFRVFRSPDNKFGFGIILILSLLLMIYAPTYRKKVFVTLLSIVILIQGYLLFTGIVIKGENTSTSSDRIISIPKEYKEVSNFLNKHAQSYGYVVTIPSIGFGHFALSNNKKYIGQDLLPKLTVLPFVSPSSYSGMTQSTYEKLSQAMEKNNISLLKDFPIKFIIVRYDIGRSTLDSKYDNSNKVSDDLKNKISKEFEPAFKNKLFEIYKNPKSLPIIQSENVTFKMINPVKYYISFKNIKKEQKIYFYQSYNSNWKLYPKSNISISQCEPFVLHSFFKVKECNGENKFLGMDDLGYIWRKPIFDNLHTLGNTYANSWVISPVYVKNNLERKYYKLNPDGSIDLELVLYFKTQSYFYNGVTLSFLYFIIVFGIILTHSFKKNLLK